MNIVFFSHPVFLGSISTQRYARWLAEGMEQRGHRVQLWIPEPRCFNLPVPTKLKKWLGYADQYIFFPYWVKKQVKKQPEGTLFVLTDHSLGIWSYLINSHAHVVHCHDFLAQFSAMGRVAENPITWSGRKYQAFIRRGFRRATHFISISEKTREDLHELLDSVPVISKVIYNGLVQPYTPARNTAATLAYVAKETGIDLSGGYLLHVGGNQWNKNRRGMIEIYTQWCENPDHLMPLMMIGPAPDHVIRKVWAASPFRHRIHFLIDQTDDFVARAYQAATAFIFPSMAEGFGWPIAEAMASGTPVITTSDMPMMEVAGDAALFIQKRPSDEKLVEQWAKDSANVIDQLLHYTKEERRQLIDRGLRNAERFDSQETIAKIERVYEAIARQAVDNLPPNDKSDVSAQYR
ncbi:Glycosyltransferase involved in cell wall bisynthesis [Dyadobacter sp. SG02]|uniref:glycosyltransferase family 4 protein n=1 Tax=Dyadobacter sp. SG02 TaxID=1855291 RepID=UPI0008D21FFA|nr:glycosyltransferase family 1 protein [Dyadobacter sp. SG02]SEJ39160.1 Glycosyltransferase involved in cell wall bisynthesis [Dyadobacter sp. SG02]